MKINMVNGQFNFRFPLLLLTSLKISNFDLKNADFCFKTK